MTPKRLLLFLSCFFISAGAAPAANLPGSAKEISQPVNKTRIVSNQKTIKLSGDIEITELKKSLFDLINYERSKASLKKYELNQDAEKIAQSHSDEMAKADLLSFSDKEGLAIAERAKALGITKWVKFGESISQYGKSENSVESALKTWLETPKDKNNILSKSFDYIGIGITRNAKGNYYFTVVTIDKTAFIYQASQLLEMKTQLFNLLNEQRIKRGVKGFQRRSDIEKTAQLHSDNMAKGNYFSHAGQDGSMVDDRAASVGVSDWLSIGENISYNKGYESPGEAAVTQWMNSVSHRENILNEMWDYVGIGIAESNSGVLYFTTVFLQPKR